ncbi:ankyrin repeat domain-containing protein [Skeletonema marinoi]|uniref:Ankyrin repeat domain-containing protein n=1 Tax=Skeletonema marinoi TaxID=267567 RepID=A0AAD9DIQ8_9STRA|nr:ankyrin repeat domain-containing protein [Skeletonema marinoi]
MEDDGSDDNEAKMPAIQNDEGDSVSSDAAMNENKNYLPPCLKRRKRSESDTSNHSKEDDNTTKPPALKRNRQGTAAASAEESNLPFAPSIDEYLQSPHDYAPRPEWCHPTTNNSASSPSSGNQGVEFAGVASTQNAAAADPAAAARMNAAAAFERLMPAAGLGVGHNIANMNDVMNRHVNNDNDAAPDNPLPRPPVQRNNLEAVNNLVARLRNGDNPPGEVNAAVVAAAQEVANNMNGNVAAIPLAAVARQINAPNRNNDQQNNNRERRHHHHHHRRRRILVPVGAGGGGAQQRQQLRDAIGSIEVGAQQLRRAIANVPRLSAQQRAALRNMIGGGGGQRRAAGGQLGQVDIAAIEQILRAAPRQAGGAGLVIGAGGGGQPDVPMLNLQALNAMPWLVLRGRQQQPVLQPQQPVPPEQQGPPPRPLPQPAGPPRPWQQQEPAPPAQQQQEEQEPAPPQQPLQLQPHEQQLPPPELNPPAQANAADANPPDEANIAAEGSGSTSNANEANNVQGPPGKISVFGNDLDTVLHLAIKRGAVDAALDLIEGGACIDFPNAKGITPLMTASQEGNVIIARALLDKGAKANNTTIRGSTALIQACHFGRLNVVEELLKHGALIEQANYKNTTALMRSSQEGHEHVVKLLLQHNAVVNRRNDERMTALMLCSQRGHSGIVKMLLKAGAEIDAKTSQDSTSLMLACKRKNLEVAKILVAAGTELKLKDCKNRTVLETATRRGNADFARILTDDAQIRLVKEEARRERNFCMIRLWHLLNWERATIRVPPNYLNVHNLAEDLENPVLQQLCPSKRTLVRAMTMPAPVIELITAFIPLPLSWEKRLSLLSSRSHVDPDTAVYNALDLLDEVLEEGGILEAFDLADMPPPVSFNSWTYFRGWCGRCDVILSRCQNEDTSNIFAHDASGDNTPRHVQSAQSQRRQANYLQVVSRAPTALAEVLASSPYEMPPVLVERLKSNGDIQSLARRLTSGVHFEPSVVNEMIVLARMAVMWCESRPFY